MLVLKPPCQCRRWGWLSIARLRLLLAMAMPLRRLVHRVVVVRGRQHRARPAPARLWLVMGPGWRLGLVQALMPARRGLWLV